MIVRQPKPACRCRSASVLVCVLVVLLLVGMLSVQTIQTLFVIRRSDNERAKIHQARELLALARQIDWNAAATTTINLSIPESTSPNAIMYSAIIERQVNAEHPLAAPTLATPTEAVPTEAACIVVRFPADQPGEVTTTGETYHE